MEFRTEARFASVAHVFLKHTIPYFTSWFCGAQTLLQEKERKKEKASQTLAIHWNVANGKLMGYSVIMESSQLIIGCSGISY